MQSLQYQAIRTELFILAATTFTACTFYLFKVVVRYRFMCNPRRRLTDLACLYVAKKCTPAYYTLVQSSRLANLDCIVHVYVQAWGEEQHISC
jgi:PhoPQ-activated pathogenicity-related protein